MTAATGAPTPGSAAEVHTFSVDLGRVVLEGLEAGTLGAPLVVLLHGFPESCAAWRPQLRALAAAGFHAVAPNQRGYGGSSRPRRVRDYRSRELRADVVALIDHLGHEQADVVGHDWGGALTWSLAAWHPERVRRAVVCNCPPAALLMRSLWANGARQLRRSWYMVFFQIPWLAPWLLARDGARALERVYESTAIHRERWSTELVPAHRRAFGDGFGPVAWYRAALWLDGRESLAAPVVQPPLRLIWGLQDTALDASLIDGMADYAASLDIVRLDDAGHFVQSDAPEAVCEAILSWLQTTP